MHEGLPHFAEVVMPLQDERTTSRYGYATFSVDTGDYAWYGPNRALNWSNGEVLNRECVVRNKHIIKKVDVYEIHRPQCNRLG